jgi:hypothetical protein
VLPALSDYRSIFGAFDLPPHLTWFDDLEETEEMRRDIGERPSVPEIGRIDLPDRRSRRVLPERIRVAAPKRARLPY